MVGKHEKKDKKLEKPSDSSQVKTIYLKCSNLSVPEVSQAAGSIIVAVIAALCFVWSLTGDFVFDDNEAILNNKDVRMETKLFSLFKHDFWGENITSALSHKSYRPLTVLTFRLNYWAAGGYQAVGFHLVNILLHVFNCMLALRVFSVIFGGISVSKQGSKAFSSPKSSLLAALLFATHPIHTENVAGIVGRADLLCAFFFFASFLTYARNFSTASRKTVSKLPETVSWPSMLMCIVFATLALFCKEQGITVLGLCIVFDLIQIIAVKKSALKAILVTGVVSEDEFTWLKALLKRIAVLIAAIAILMSWRMRIMGGNPPKFQEGDNPSAFASTWILRVINYNYIYCLNVWLLLNPFWLCFDWSMGCVPLIKTIYDSRTLAPMSFWLCILAFLWKSCRAIDSHFGRTILMLLAFAVVPFIPSANIFFTVGFVIAERNLYISSIGFIGIVVLGIVVLFENESLRKVLKVSIQLLIILFGLRCCQRSHDWLSEERLFLSGEAVCPLNAKVHYNIGNVISKKGETDTAIMYYRESIRLNPLYDQPLNNLGNILQKFGKPLEAEELLTKAVTISPKFAAGWMNLGVTKAHLKKYKEAEKCYMNAIRNRNFYPDAYYNLGNMFLEMKSYDKAISNYKNVIEMKPNHESSWINLVLLYEEIGKQNISLSIGKKAVKVLPNSAGVMYTVGNLYGKAGLYEEAEKLFLRAIELVPTDATYNGNLAVLYHRWNRYKEAEIYYLRSLKINPQNKVMLANFNKLRKIAAKG